MKLHNDQSNMKKGTVNRGDLEKLVGTVFFYSAL